MPQLKDTGLFLKEHKLRSEDIDIRSLIDSFTSEMQKGLSGIDSSLKMIPTYIEADNKFKVDVPVLAIDAGGTNFRAAMVSFSRTGLLEISNWVNEKMPGLEGEISKDEFFNTIASYVRPIAEKVESIGFCFSYPTEILPDKDGRLIHFTKEVQAPGVVGQLIGKSLLAALGMPEKQIVILNDTVATLLAGKSASLGHSYDSFIGYILGTGTNTCYIETNNNIQKNKNLDPSKSQIINIESGNFDKAPRTDIDMFLDRSTVNPDSHTFEKMISGGYFGNLCLIALKSAAREGVFSSETAHKLMTLNELASEEADKFLTVTGSDRGPLYSCIKDADDDKHFISIISCILDRAALLVAANLVAVVLKTGKGKTKENPILITVEGSTFFKLHNMKDLTDKYFREFLTGDNERHAEFTEVKHASLVGAALSALIA